MDLSRALSSEEFAAIREAFRTELILTFPDQVLTPEQHIAFSRRLTLPLVVARDRAVEVFHEQNKIGRSVSGWIRTKGCATGGCARLRHADAAIEDSDYRTAEPRRELMEIVDDRDQNAATPITSQLPPAKWHDVIDEPTFADAILDRIVHNAHRPELDGPAMRKIKADQNGPATLDQAQGK